MSSNNQNSPSAATPIWTALQLGTSMGYVQMTAITTAKGLTSIPAGASRALVVAEAQALRWADDGVTVPTASVGMLLPVNQPTIFTNLAGLQVIAAASGTVLNITYY